MKMPSGKTKEELDAISKGTRISGSNAVEYARRSAEARRAKKTFREQFEAELEAEISQRDKNGNVIGKTTVKDAITKQMVQRALKGNTRAFELIRDTIGEKPSETIVVTDIDPEVVKEVELMVHDS
jgi:hypothetical protein